MTEPLTSPLHDRHVALGAKFSEFGGCISVVIATDKETKKSKGFAFIEMENEEDAEFCKNCGYKLDPTPITGDDKIDPNKSFLSKNSKIIVFSVAMIALLAVTAGFFMFMDEYAIFTQQNQLAFNKSHEQATPKAEWHKVANYTGIGNSYRSFNIKGAKFKIIINATPLMNYNTNS